MNKIIVLAFIIALLVIGMDLFRFAFISANGGYFIGFWAWYAILACKILFLYLLASRVYRLVHVIKSILWIAAYRNYKNRGKV